MLLSQLIFSSTLLLFIVLIHILYCIVLYCIVLYYSDLEHFCGFYAIQNKLSNYQIIKCTRSCENAMLLIGGRNVARRHSMIDVKHEIQFQLINSIVNMQHFKTLEFVCTNMCSGSYVCFVVIII